MKETCIDLGTLTLRQYLEYLYFNNNSCFPSAFNKDSLHVADLRFSFVDGTFDLNVCFVVHDTLS